MPLVDVELVVDSGPLPGDVARFLCEAEHRIERFQMTSRAHAFVPSDYAGAYHVLRSIVEASVAPGPRFCEWGSGFGVVASLAALLDYEAYGIEIEPELVESAESLAGDFEVPVTFVRDSFIPPGGEDCADVPTSFGWLTADAGRADQELDLATDDFDVVFAYPWPDEEKVIDDLFYRFGAVGAVLVTYHGGEGFRVRRKVKPRRGSPRSNGRRSGWPARGRS
jgi:hypothetical protein